MNSFDLHKTMKLTADYFDGRKVGCFGNTGYRKTTDLSKFCACIEDLAASGIIRPRERRIRRPGVRRRQGESSDELFRQAVDRDRNRFGNSFRIRTEEKRTDFTSEEAKGRSCLPKIFSSSREARSTTRPLMRFGLRTGVDFGDVDLFYTYITLHDVFAEKIAERGRPGAYLPGLRLQQGPSRLRIIRAGKPGRRRPGDSGPLQEKRVSAILRLVAPVLAVQYSDVTPDVDPTRTNKNGGTDSLIRHCPVDKQLAFSMIFPFRNPAGSTP